MSEKIYQRTETHPEGDRTVTMVSLSDGSAEANHAQMGGRHEVREMSSVRGLHCIEYKDGRTVRLELMNAPIRYTLEEALEEAGFIYTGTRGGAWGYPTSAGMIAELKTYTDRTPEDLRVMAAQMALYVDLLTPAQDTVQETDNKGNPIVTVNGKRYVVSKTVIRKGNHGTWSVRCDNASYWSERDGEKFGPTRTTSEEDRPGTVGAAIWATVQTR